MNYDKVITLMVPGDLYLDLKAMALIKQTDGFSTIIRFAINRYMEVLKKELSDDQRDQFDRVRSRFDLSKKLEAAIESDQEKEQVHD